MKPTDARLEACNRVRLAYGRLHDAEIKCQTEIQAYHHVATLHEAACQAADKTFNPLIQHKQNSLLAADATRRRLDSAIDTLTHQIQQRKIHLGKAQTQLNPFLTSLTTDKSLYIPASIPADDLHAALECTNPAIIDRINTIYQDRSKGERIFGLNSHNIHRLWTHYTTFFNTTDAEDNLFDLIKHIEEKKIWIDAELSTIRPQSKTFFLPECNLWTLAATLEKYHQQREEAERIYHDTLAEKNQLLHQKMQAIAPLKGRLNQAENTCRISQYIQQCQAFKHQQALMTLNYLTLESGLDAMTEATQETIDLFETLRAQDPEESLRYVATLDEAQVNALLEANSLMTTRPRFNEPSLGEWVKAIETSRTNQKALLEQLNALNNGLNSDNNLTNLQALQQAFEESDVPVQHLIQRHQDKTRQFDIMADFTRVLKQRQAVEAVLTRPVAENDCANPAARVSELQSLIITSTSLLDNVAQRSDSDLRAQCHLLHVAILALQKHRLHYQTLDDLSQLTHQHHQIQQALGNLARAQPEIDDPERWRITLLALIEATTTRLAMTEKNQDAHVGTKRNELIQALPQLQAHLERLTQQSLIRAATKLLQQGQALIERFTLRTQRRALHDDYAVFFADNHHLIDQLRTKKDIPLFKTLLSTLDLMRTQLTIMAPNTPTQTTLFGEQPEEIMAIEPVMPLKPTPASLNITGYLQQCDNYLIERARTFMVRDQLSRWTHSLFGCFGGKPEEQHRKRYIFELKIAFKDAKQDPGRYQALLEKIDEGIQRFSPRAKAGPGYSFSLCATLQGFKAQLKDQQPGGTADQSPQTNLRQ